MPYIYSNPERETLPHALPNVEVFYADSEQVAEWNRAEDADYEAGARGRYGVGYYYAFGFQGCAWDSEPMGPFDTMQEAIDDARENDDSDDEEVN